MGQATDQYPRFEHGSPSAQYQQISNFSVNYLEGLLVNLIHMELPDNRLEKDSEVYVDLQQRLHQRERTVRHAFQFQIEKRFSEFRLIRRSRLNANRSSDWQSLGLAGQNPSRVLSRIEDISEKYTKQFEPRLDTLTQRLKLLVHRSDQSKDDNPLSPENLCNAFLSSVDALKLTGLQTCQLFELFDFILESQLDNFYIQIDLGMYYLDILPELTDPELFAPPSEETLEMEPVKVEQAAEEPATYAAKDAEIDDQQVEAEPEIDFDDEITLVQSTPSQPQAEHHAELEVEIEGAATARFAEIPTVLAEENTRVDAESLQIAVD